jgi:mono/diheme cytochrome c family protein
MAKTNRTPVRIGQALIVLAAGTAMSFGHDAITTKVTYDREMVRLMISHCGSCHQPNGSAFSLMTYDDARPWAKAIGEEVLQRRMPPWGGVKGFGDFRNDKGLTEEQLELIVDWEEGGAPEGDAKDIPKDIKFPQDAPYKVPQQEVTISGDVKLAKAIKLDGILPKTVAPNASYQIIAQLPDGSIEPLLWFQNYKKEFAHPFLLRHPLDLPAGTMIMGVPASDSISLLPVTGGPAQLTGQLIKH